MKASELRIGNLVFSKGVPVQIEEIMWETVRYCFGEFPIDYVEPIPLTKEWLMKFGFKCSVVFDDNLWFNESIILFETENSEYELSWGRHIKYIHELQNIHYAFTGSEL